MTMDNFTSNNNANFYWWFGVVEDRDDPLRLGRCRTRILGYHTDDKEELPTEDLPWAIPVMPANSAGTSGVGWSPTGAVEGSWVVGFFADGENGQHPMFFGTVGSIPGGLASTGCGDGSDGSGQPGDSATSNGQQSDDTSGPVVSGPPNQEFWTLVAMCACEAESGGGPNGQSWADVAQAIYNRVGTPGYTPNGNILAVMLAKGQFESAWRFPEKSGPYPEGIANKYWKNITDIKSAAAASGRSEQYLSNVALALKDINKQDDARRFIGSRTDFLAPSEPAKKMTANGSKVQRTTASNKFGFSYNYKGSKGTRPIASSVSNYKFA